MKFYTQIIKKLFLCALVCSLFNSIGYSESIKNSVTLSLVVAGFDPTDSDSDSLPDQWENQFFDNLNSSNGDADFDNDGLKDFFEYLAGTDPTDSTSVFKITNIERIASNELKITWASSPNPDPIKRKYRILTTTGNIEDGFNSFSTEIEADSSNFATSQVISNEILSNNSKFYRIELIEPSTE